MSKDAKVVTISPVEWAEYIRETQERAWDEGWQAAWSPMSMHSRDDGPNPHRGAVPKWPACNGRPCRFCVGSDDA